MPRIVEPLPARSVLLHIGPHKTGTTAIQGALFNARPQLVEHGVLQVGHTRHPMYPVLGLAGLPGLSGDATPTIGQWRRLANKVTDAADRRVVLSSEFFADTPMDAAARAVQDLGRRRVHVVVTLRPLTRIMPSAWQQYVQNRLRTTYDEWLRSMLERPPYEKPTPNFWKRHQHDALVERWAALVGPENLTVIVLDESDRLFLMRTFEQLLDLPPGLLRPEEETSNRSLTLGEIELVRQLNVAFREYAWPAEVYRDVVRKGVVARLQTQREPARDEARITTPQWALDRAAEIGASAAEKIPQLGVRVLGDIATLGHRSFAVEQQPDALRGKATLPADAAREAVVAAVLASGVLEKQEPPPEPVTDSVRSTSSKDLARTLARRVRTRVGRQLRRGPESNSAGTTGGR